MPGTCDEYPNWKLPLCGPDGEPVLLEDLATSDRVRAVARAASARSARAELRRWPCHGNWF